MTPLAEATDRARFGGKAVGLGALTRAALRVPGGVAIDPGQLEALAAGTGAERTWDALAAIGAVFAVRSSALDEDSGAASFAGQHATVLGVTGCEQLVAAAETVRASGEASAAYREARGLGGRSSLAAVIQRVIDPVASGVLFTRDPVSGAHTLVVEAAWGLGEAVVQGLVTPDRAVLSAQGALLERTRGHKDVRLERAGSEIAEREVPAADRDRFCVPDPILAELAARTAVYESIAGGPADVEWAFDGDALWLLQCRAITTL